MPVNGYFNNYPGDQRKNTEMNFVEDLLVECIQMMGHNVYYIPRESFDEGDMIFGEYKNSKFGKAYTIEAYLNDVGGFGGQGDFFSKFGLQIQDNSNVVLSKRSFRKIIPSDLRSRPQEGDLVYVPVFQRLLEIKFIEEENLNFTLGNKNPYVYELKCEQFRYSQEQIDTGVPVVDEIEAENAYTIRLYTDQVPGNFNDFINSEVIYQSPDGTFANNTATAKLKDWYKANNTMFLYNIKGNFSTNNMIYGASSNACVMIDSVNNKEDFIERDLYDNQTFSEEANSILDLSETNPFGTP